MLEYFATHWVEWLTGGAGALLVWIAVNFSGKPFVTFLQDRSEILIAANAYAYVGGQSSEERIDDARKSLRPVEAKLTYYSQGGPWIVYVYCRLRFYNLKLAAGTLRGLFNMIGSARFSDVHRRNNLDCLRWSLGADGDLTSERIQELRQMLETPIEA